jgi:hypothetical protein
LLNEASTTEVTQFPFTFKSLKLIDPNWIKESEQLVSEISKQETDLSIWRNRIEDLKEKKHALMSNSGN